MNRVPGWLRNEAFYRSLPVFPYIPVVSVRAYTCVLFTPEHSVLLVLYRLSVLSLLAFPVVLISKKKKKKKQYIESAPMLHRGACAPGTRLRRRWRNEHPGAFRRLRKFAIRRCRCHVRSRKEKKKTKTKAGKKNCNGGRYCAFALPR